MDAGWPLRGDHSAGDGQQTLYPRLSRRQSDGSRQSARERAALAGLLLAGPGVIATLPLRPFVITFFYCAKFGAAVGVLRWICLGGTPCA